MRSAVPARRISALSVNEVVPMRLVHIDTSSTSSKRAEAFHSVTWRTLWISKVPSSGVLRPGQGGAQELDAGEVDVVAVAGVEDHLLGVALLVAHAQVIAEALGHGPASTCDGPMAR